jgi:hypothetical protein
MGDNTLRPLRFKKVDFENAKQALNAGRPIVACFNLNAMQLYNFSKFYEEKQKPDNIRILTKDDVNKARM